MNICSEVPTKRLSCILGVLLFSFTLFCPARAIGKIYKYTDESGVTHYTDRPLNQGYSVYSDDIDGHISIDYQDDIYIDPIIERACKRYDIDFALIKAIIKTESDFNPTAISSAGAKGLMQLMPETAYEMKVSDPFDPEQNIMGGTKYFKYLLDRFDYDLRMSLAAYNAGETTVMKCGGIPGYSETKGFIQKVLSFYKHYKGQNSPQRDAVYHYVDESNVLHISNISNPFPEGVSR